MSGEFNLLSFLKVNIPEARSSPSPSPSPTPSARILAPSLKAYVAAPPVHHSPRSSPPRPTSSTFKTAYQNQFANPSTLISPRTPVPPPAQFSALSPPPQVVKQATESLAQQRSPQPPRSPPPPPPEPASPPQPVQQIQDTAPEDAPHREEGADLTEAAMLPPPPIPMPRMRDLRAGPIPLPPTHFDPTDPDTHSHHGSVASDDASSCTSLTEKFGPECDLCANAQQIQEKADRIRQLREEEARFYREQQAKFEQERERERQQFMQEKLGQVEAAKEQVRQLEERRANEKAQRQLENEAYRNALAASDTDRALEQARKALADRQKAYGDALQDQIADRAMQRQMDKEADRQFTPSSPLSRGFQVDPNAVNAIRDQYRTDLDQQVADRRRREQAEKEADRMFAPGPVDPSALQSAHAAQKQARQAELMAEYQRAAEQKRQRAEEERREKAAEAAQLAAHLAEEQDRMREQFAQMRARNNQEAAQSYQQQMAQKERMKQLEKEYDAQFVPKPPPPIDPKLIECRTCHRMLPPTRFNNARTKPKRRSRRSRKHS